jgi:hypothetical protein
MYGLWCSPYGRYEGEPVGASPQAHRHENLPEWEGGGREPPPGNDQRSGRKWGASTGGGWGKVRRRWRAGRLLQGLVVHFWLRVSWMEDQLLSSFVTTW